MGKRKTDPEEAEPTPKKGRGKKKVEQADVEEAESPEPAKKGRTKKVKEETKPQEPYVDELGWNIHPPSLIYRTLGQPQASSKIAAFDLDGTLANVKSRAMFPVDENDWKLFNKKVPKIIKQYVEEGYKVVIFSNQNGIKSALEGKMATKVKKRTGNVLQEIGVPADVFFGTGQDVFRKPEKGMWDFFTQNCNSGIAPDLELSFFVGDAAGRVGDIADSDKKFAENIGLPFKTPEDVFGEGDSKKVLAAPIAGEGGAEGAATNHNAGLCDAFNKLAEKFAKEGDRFKSNAYAKVAKVLAAYPAVITSGKEVSKLAGVGKASVAKIDEYLATGTMGGLEEAAKEAPAADVPSSGSQPAPKKESVALKFI